MFTVIHGKEEFEKAYYYKNSKPKHYPKKYPCILYQEHHEGGLAGEFVNHALFYAPKNVDFKSYVKGLKDGIEFMLW
jgi:hypothetical protein